MINREDFNDRILELKDQLYLTAWSVLRNPTEAEDAVSSAILHAYEHLDQLRSVKKFKAWMITITKNEALKVAKKRMYMPGDEQVVASLEPTNDHYDELSDVLNKLSDEYRLVVVLYYYDGLSLKDIAKVLDIPVGTVKSRLSRAKDALRDILESSEGRDDDGSDR